MNNWQKARMVLERGKPIILTILVFAWACAEIGLMMALISMGNNIFGILLISIASATLSSLIIIALKTDKWWHKI